MFNQITLLGNLTRDIELRYTQGGVAIANCAIATSHKFTSNGEKKEEVCFIDVAAFGKTAEIMNQYLRKGSKVFIIGRLKFEQWTDNNGQKRSKHVVSVESMKMLDSKQDGQQQGNYSENPNSSPQQYQQPPQQTYQQQAPQQQYQQPPQNQQQGYP